jgi:N-formylglutamate amidohydrolase
VRLPFVISVPHCSGRIPEYIRPDFALSNDEIADSIDLGTREIFGVLDAGDILCSEWSRLVVDLSRDPERRDHKGVIARIDYFGRSIYHASAIPDEEEISNRLREYYWPYHNRLREALEGPHIRGMIDCHSLCGIGPPEAPDAGRKRKDIVLSNNGDNGGKMTPALGKTTCPSELLVFMKQVFLSKGFSVAINDPYTAGFISTHYAGEFADREKFAVQIEINQDLYAGPGTGKIVQGRLAEVRSKIRRCFDEIAERV